MTNHAENILCYVTDRRAFSAAGNTAQLIACVRAAAKAGVDWIQIREKDLSGCELLQLAADTIAAVREIPQNKTRVLVNGRLDIAIAARADGVHLGESSLPVAAVREFRDRSNLVNHFLIGASCHSIDAALAAESDGADYIFGPVFATPSKAAFGQPQGLHVLASVCRAVTRIPVLAIGGVTAENVTACRNAGAAGIGAIRLFQESNDLPGVIQRVRAAR